MSGDVLRDRLAVEVGVLGLTLCGIALLRGAWEIARAAWRRPEWAALVGLLLFALSVWSAQ